MSKSRVEPRALLLKPREFPEQCVEITRSAIGEARPIEQVRVGDDRRAALPDPATSDEVVAGDPARSFERTGRDGEDIAATEPAKLGAPPVRTLQADAPVLEQPRVHEH